MASGRTRRDGQCHGSGFIINLVDDGGAYSSDMGQSVIMESTGHGHVGLARREHMPAPR
jgi:hypothetical protein